MTPPLDAELMAWIDGQLEPARRAEVAAWLQEHPEVAARLHAYRAQKEALHRAFDGVLDEPLPERLRVAAAAPRRGWRVAAVLAWMSLGFAAGYAVHEASMPLGAAPLAQRAALAHAVYVPEVRHPVEVGADQEAHLLQWLSKRVGTPLKAPSFQSRGFELVGGRLLPGPQGPVAQFMYQDASGRRLTLYIGGDREHQATAFRYAREGNLSVFYWLDGTLGYALSGELPREELLPLADAAYRELIR
ncbi:hypothetical protein BURK2_02318 [Burkholderiales bacterium]|nr:hypothetical protein BURK2_02318 [Burkholderiales bacterium]